VLAYRSNCAHWPRKQAGLVRIEPRFVHAIRNQVGLSGKLGDPENCDPCRRKAIFKNVGVWDERRVTHGNMKFRLVRWDKRRGAGNSEIPTKTDVPIAVYFHRLSRLGRVLDCVNDSCPSRRKKHNNDQDGNEWSQASFNLCASIHLGWLAVLVRRSAAETSPRRKSTD